MAVLAQRAVADVAVSVLRVLLVEDSPSDALLVRAMLQESGEPVLVRMAASLEAAIGQVTGPDPIDCVLLDLGLPDADGLETLAGVQAAAPHLAVVVLTGLRDDASGLAAVEAGAQDYLVKGDVTGPRLVRSLRFACERQASLEAWREASDQLVMQARLLNAVGQSVIATDATGRITYWNRAAEQMYGWSAEEVRGRPVVEVTASETSVTQAEEILDALATGQSWSGEFWVKRRDGSRFFALVTDTPVYGEDGSVLGVIGVSSDVTERAEAHAALRRSEERYRHIVETALEGIWVIDTDARTTFVNRRMADILGVAAVDVVGRGVVDFLDAEGRAEVRTRLANRREGVAERYEVSLLRPDGERRYVIVAASPLYDDEGSYVGSLGMVTDISDRYAAAAALRDSQRLLAEAQHIARVGSWELDLGSGAMTWSEEHYGLLGYDEGEVTPCVEAFLVRVHPADRPRARLAFQGLTTRSERVEFEVRLVRPASEERWLDVRAEPVARPEGAFVRVHGTSQDVTEQKRHERELSRLALYDPLTGLPNRTLLADRLETAQERTRRGAGGVGVLFIDLDRFKLVNDSRGHSTGDALLQEVSRRLCDAVRPADTVGRFGGDEFVIVCEGLRDEAEAEALADRVIRGLEPAMHVGGLELFITASVGITIGHGDEPADVLLSAADAAMYRAKEEGRGRRASFDRSLVERAEHRLVLETDLRSALDSAQLRVLYQPVVSLRSGRVVGAEALLRWEHPVRGLVGPDEFITVAEEIGVIAPIGAWVLDEACAELAALHRCDPTLSMSVNVSARQLAVPEFSGEVVRAIERAGIPAGRLVLEVTETVLMEDVEIFSSALSTLQAVGVRLAMDDFGTGFSSLAYLQRFPLDLVKIDRTFIRGVARSASDGALVRAMVAMARALGMDVLAEGVETADQLAMLRDLGCSLAQGFLFARPLPAADLDALLASGATW